MVPTGSRTMARVRVAADDATRLADVEGLADERKDSTTGFLLRAPQGPQPRHPRRKGGGRQGKRLPIPPLRQGLTPAAAPTNGHGPLDRQALLREWVQGRAHPASAARNKDLRDGLPGSTDQDHALPARTPLSATG